MDKIRYNVISEIDNYEDIMEDFLRNSTLEDIVLLSRYSYLHCFQPLLSDQDYDEIMKLPELAHLKDIKYEDDDITPITEIIEKLEIKAKPKVIEDNVEEYQDLVNRFPTNESMPYFGTVDELINYLPDAKADYLITYKHDGWNISCYYVPGNTEVYYAHTRGRDQAKVSECTELMRRLTPKMNVEMPIKIIGELVLKREAFEDLKRNYPVKNWVNIRSSISTFIAGNIPEKYWDALEFKAFGIQGVHDITKVQQYHVLKAAGFSVPYGGVAKGSSAVRDVLDNIIPKHYTDEYSKMYECDGVTVALDNINETPTICAYKGGVWGSEILTTRIEAFYFSTNAKKFTPIARVTPVKSRIGNTITNVPMINLARLIENKLNVGDLIEIEYQSQQNVYFKRKVEEDIDLAWEKGGM